MLEIGKVPLRQPPTITTVAPGVHMVGGMGMSLTVETNRGLLHVDTGSSPKHAARMLDVIRQVTDAPLWKVVYSHGHNGYNVGVGAFREHAAARGESRPEVVAHENVVRRYRRYERTAALQERLAEWQFDLPPGSQSGRLRQTLPDTTYTDRLALDCTPPVELRWAPSETDDATAVWLPEQRVLYGGPATIDSLPNIGTPLRTLRDTLRWAGTLDGFVALDPEILVREFGAVVTGAAEVRRVLETTAAALRWIDAATVERMNQGLGVEAIVADLVYPPELFDHDFLAPTYGHPDYIVRDVFRSENGWWDRNPTSLHPATPDAVAAARFSALGDPDAVLDRARRLQAAGETQLALHVVDLVAEGPADEPAVRAARRLKAELCRQRAGEVTSIVAQGLYRSWARREEG